MPTPRKLVVDKFGRDAFCEILAELLASRPAESRVISLEGEWGEGKTTAIESVIDALGRLHADREPFVVRVTPWKVGGVTDMTQYVLSEFTQISPQEKGRVRLLKRVGLALELARYADALSVAKGEPSAAVIHFVVRGVAWAANRLFGCALSLESRKRRLGEVLSKLARPVVVFIDDLDRLLPDELSSVVRFCRAVGDFPGVTYVLAYDHPRVVAGLGKAGIPEPALFLDKIVAMRMHLPPIGQGDIRSYLLESLTASRGFDGRHVFEGSEDRQYEILDFYLSGAVATPRAVERIVLKVESIPEEIYKEVEYWDVVGVCSLAVVAPEIFDLLRSRARFFVGEWRDFPDIGTGNSSAFESLKSQLSGLIDQIEDPARRYVRSLIQSLFPLTEGDPRVTAEWLELHGRVGASRALYTYFRMALGSGSVPLLLVDLVLQGDESSTAELRAAVDSESRLSTLLALIDERLRMGRHVDPVSAERALELLMNHWSWLVRERGSRKLRTSGVRPLAKVFGELLQRSGDRAGILDYALRNDSTLAIGALLLDYANDRSGRSPLDLRRFDESDVKKLANRLSLSVGSALDDEGVEATDITSVFYALRRISKDEFDGVVERFCKDARGRRRLLSVLGITTTSETIGHVANWSADLLREDSKMALMEESQVILSMSIEDKVLWASAKALATGERIVVETGEKSDF